MSDQVVSKAAFATIVGVTKGRVSQWVRDRQIPPSALVGEGRHARINVDLARAALRGRLDPGQRLPGANGQHTNLDGPVDRPPPGFDSVNLAQNDVDRGMLTMGLYLTYRAGALAASLAAAAGAPMQVAYALHGMMTIGLLQDFEGLLGPDLANRVRYTPAVIEEVNWAALASIAGEPVDLDAWKAHAAVVGSQ